MAEIFVYGTLMCEEIFEAVAGLSPQRRRAVVRDYRRLRVRDEHYPGMCAASGFEVEGMVCFDISPEIIQVLDDFEGEMYSRRILQVFLDDGSIEAHAYVVKSRFLDRLESREWDFAEFLKKGKEDFVKGYSGYSAVKMRSEKQNRQ